MRVGMTSRHFLDVPKQILIYSHSSMCYCMKVAVACVVVPFLMLSPCWGPQDGRGDVATLSMWAPETAG